MRKFKKSKYPSKNRIRIRPIALICIFAIILGMIYVSKVKANSKFVVVSGRVWEDTNQNVEADEGIGIPNIDVFLCDESGNKLKNEVGNIITTKTDANGYYQFNEEIGNLSNYTIKYSYDGAEYELTGIIKQELNYSNINSFVEKVNVVWNFPDSGKAKQREFIARLNQFKINNKNEYFLKHDANGIYKDNQPIKEKNVIIADMDEAGNLNFLKQKSIFCIYIDNTEISSKQEIVKKLNDIKNTFDDNDYKIIISFSNDYADESFKNQIKALQSNRTKVVENARELETTFKEYLAGKAEEKREKPFGEENKEKRDWLNKEYSMLSTQQRIDSRQRGETIIEATSKPIETDGKLIYISAGLKRLANTEGKRNPNDEIAQDSGDKLVVGSAFWTEDKSKVTYSSIKVELFKQVYSKDEYDEYIKNGAYGEINEKPEEGYYGKILIGDKNKNKVLNDEGNYSISYPDKGTYMVRFTYGNNDMAQRNNINGEKCKVPVNKTDVSRNYDSQENNATEDDKRRIEINKYFCSDEDGDGIQGINNYKTRLKLLNMNELIDKSQMTASTNWFVIDWKDTLEEGETEDDLEPPPTMYANLGLTKRENVGFKITNDIEAIKIILSDNSTERELVKGKDKRLEFDPVYLQLDDEYLHGATLKVQYMINIENTGEIPITSMRLMDYLDQQYKHLHYVPGDKMITEDKTNNDYGWVYLKDFQIEENSNDHNFQNVMPKGRMYLENRMQEKINPGEKKTLRLVASVAISKRDEEYNYGNSIEVINYNNELGRIHDNLSEINVGDLNPIEDTKKASNANEVRFSDQDVAQEVVITKPTGK